MQHIVKHLCEKLQRNHVAKITNIQVYVRVIDFEGFAKWVYDQESHQKYVKNDTTILPKLMKKQCKTSARKNDAKIMKMCQN